MFGGLNSLLLRFTTLSEQFWFGDYNYKILARFRTTLAVVSLLFFAKLFPLLREGLTSQGFHVSSDLIDALNPITLPLLPNELFLPFYLLLMFSLASLLLFPRSRWPAILGSCMLFYIFDADYISAYAGHKILLISLLVIALAPIPQTGQSTISAWPVRILQITLVSTYFGNGLSKFFFGDWLDHPELLWSVIGGIFFGPVSAVITPYIPKMFWTFCEYGALIFELWLPWGLIIPSTRKITLLCGFVFHLGIAILLQGLWPFTMTILMFYLLFLPPPKEQSEC